MSLLLDEILGTVYPLHYPNIEAQGIPSIHFYTIPPALGHANCNSDL